MSERFEAVIAIDWSTGMGLGCGHKHRSLASASVCAAKNGYHRFRLARSYRGGIWTKLPGSMVKLMATLEEAEVKEIIEQAWEERSHGSV